MTTTADGVRITRPAAIIDANGVAWSLRYYDNAIMYNGRVTNGTASAILAWHGVAYFLGRNGNYWTASGFNVWADVGATDPSATAPPVNPTITAFSVAPTTIHPGDSVTLNASVSNAVSVTLGGVPITLPYVATPLASFTYTIVAHGAAGTADATSPSILVTVLPASGAGVPTSLTFTPFATDPAASTTFGFGLGPRGYGSLRPNLAGEMILFGSSNGHDSHAYNGIDIIGTAGVRNVRPHTPVNLGPATDATGGLLDGSGLTFFMGRDNQGQVVLPNGKLYVTDGEREPGVFGNYGGVADLTTGAWQISDAWGTMPGVDGSVQPKLEDGATARIDALGIAVFYGSYGNLFDGLQILAPNAAGAANPYHSIQFANADLASQFPGSRHLRYVSSQCFQHGTQLRIYGGHGGDTPTSHYDLFAVELADINHPQGVLISTNTVADDARVQGEAIVAYEDAAHNGVVVFDGAKANWYDYATGAWSVLTVTNPGGYRVSPEAGGSGAMGGYSAAFGSGVVLWSNGSIETVTLDGSPTDDAGGSPTDDGGVITPPPPPPPPPFVFGLVTDISALGVVSGFVSTDTSQVELRIDGSTVGDFDVVVIPTAGAFTAQLSQRFNDAQSHVLRAIAYTAHGNGYFDNADHDDGRNFTLPLLPPGTPPLVTPPPAAPPPTQTPPADAPPPVTDVGAPLPGSLTLATTPVTFTGSMATVFNGKHYDFARIGGRWYKHAGDHASIESGGQYPDEQDGNQETFSVNFAANDWVAETNYLLRTAGGSPVQIALPDDGCVCGRGNEVWSFVSERVSQVDTATRTATMRAHFGADVVTQEMDSIGAFDVTSKHWRPTLSPRPNMMRGDRLFRIAYDASRDFFYGPCAGGGDLVFLLIDGATGDDITFRDSTGAAVKYNYNALGQITAHIAGIAVDEANRIAYIYDHTTAKLWSIPVDGIRNHSAAPTLVADLTSRGESGQSDQAAIKITFEPNVRAVVINANNMHAYEVDNGKCTTWARRDGFVGGNGQYVPTSCTFYDPDTTDVIGIGTIDWSDTGAKMSSVYWRHKITR